MSIKKTPSPAITTLRAGMQRFEILKPTAVFPTGSLVTVVDVAYDGTAGVDDMTGNIFTHIYIHTHTT